MKNLPLIEVTELIKGIESSDNFQDDLSIADLNGDLINYEEKRLEHSTPMRLNALLMILVQEGTADISVDYIPYKIEKNTFITLMPTHIIQVSKVSKDLRGRLLIVSRSFLDGYTTPAGKKNSMVHYMQIRKNPCAAMSAEETEHISGQFSILREKMKLRTHFFQKEALQNALVGFFIELANIFMGKKELMTAPTLSRKEELFEQFLQLLFEHCKEQHVVTFYAEKLFITPQYLSLILKELTGKSANKWIDDALIVEAKMLLKAPQATVQQVADILHFSDQSTFGKFFKKHMGISPMEYRKSLSGIFYTLAELIPVDQLTSPVENAGYTEDYECICRRPERVGKNHYSGYQDQSRHQVEPQRYIAPFPCGYQ